MMLRTESTLTSETAPTYITSTGYSATHLAATKAGVDIVRTFLGSSSPTLITNLQGGGTAADMTAAKTACDSWMTTYKDTRSCQSVSQCFRLTSH
jgi:hypothetical protein